MYIWYRQYMLRHFICLLYDAWMGWICTIEAIAAIAKDQLELKASLNLNDKMFKKITGLFLCDFCENLMTFSDVGHVFSGKIPILNLDWPSLFSNFWLLRLARETKMKWYPRDAALCARRIEEIPEKSRWNPETLRKKSVLKNYYEEKKHEATQCFVDVLCSKIHSHFSFVLPELLSITCPMEERMNFGICFSPCWAESFTISSQLLLPTTCLLSTWEKCSWVSSKTIGWQPPLEGFLPKSCWLTFESMC